MQQVSDAMDSVEPYCRSDHRSALHAVHLGEDRYLQLCKCLALVMACDHVLSKNKIITNKKTVTVSGKTDDVSSKPVTVTVNGATVTVGTDGTFTKDVTLAEGANTITIVAKDKAGKTTTVTRKVTVDTSAPVIKSVTLTPNPVDCGKTFIIAVEITD